MEIQYKIYDQIEKKMLRNVIRAAEQCIEVRRWKNVMWQVTDFEDLEKVKQNVNKVLLLELKKQMLI